MTKRTRTSLLVGVTLLVAGAGGAGYLATRESASAADASAAGKVTAYYVAVPIEVGKAASTALADGSIRSKAVFPEERPADGVSDPTQLSGRVAASAIPAGTIVTTGMFPEAQTRAGTFVIPPGKRALALEIQPLAGVAGFVGAGDRVDIYGVVKNSGPPAVRLVVQGADVLNVNGTGLPATQGQLGSPNSIYLLAVTPGDAERLIYLNEFEKLYFDLVPKNEGPVRTPGAGPAGALAV